MENKQENKVSVDESKQKPLKENTVEKHPVHEQVIEHEPENKSSAFNKEILEQQAKSVFSEISRLVTAWFSKQPFSAFAKRINITTSLSILGILVIIEFLKNGTPFALLQSVSINLFRGFSFIAFLLPIAFYALLAVAMMVVAKVSKTKYHSYQDALSLVAIAAIPSGLINLVGFLIGLINANLAVPLNLLSVVVLIIALYMGVEVHLGEPEKSPFWIFVVSIVVMAIVLLFLVGLLVASQIRANFDYANPFRNGRPFN